MSQPDLEPLLRRLSTAGLVLLTRNESQDIWQGWQPAATIQHVVDRKWLGSPGASDAEIAAAEARLGQRLPRSYRDFLQRSNGWLHVAAFRPPVRFVPTTEVDGFSRQHADWLAAWRDGAGHAAALHGESARLSDAEYLVYGPDQQPDKIRDEYLDTAVAISEEMDAGIYLLNPSIVTTDGEWEAWLFANWLGGARRYRSFYELMIAECEQLEAQARGGT